MASPVESLTSISSSVSTSSPKRRIQIFRNEIPSILSNTEMTAEIASLLVEVIFSTTFICDDRGSRVAVDNVVIKALGETFFMKTFAGTLVQFMEKQFKFQSYVGCDRLLNWSFLLLTNSQFPSVSKNAVSRRAQAQASVLHIGMQGSSHVRRNCKKSLFFLFSKAPNIYGTYMDELRDSSSVQESEQAMKQSDASLSRFTY